MDKQKLFQMEEFSYSETLEQEKKYSLMLVQVVHFFKERINPILLTALILMILFFQYLKKYLNLSVEIAVFHQK